MKAIIFTFFLILANITLAQSDKWLTLMPAPTKTTTFTISENFPSKASDNIHFKVDASVSENIEVYLLDAENNQITKTKVSISPQNSEINIPLYHLPAGKYAVYLQGKKNYCQKYFYISKS